MGWVSTSPLPGSIGVCVGDEIDQHSAQIVDIRAAGAQHLRRRWVVQHGEQQVLDRDEFVPFLPCLDKGHVQADFKFLRDHDSGFLQLAS